MRFSRPGPVDWSDAPASSLNSRTFPTFEPSQRTAAEPAVASRRTALRSLSSTTSHSPLLPRIPRVARVTIDRPAFAAMFRTGSATGATMARQQFDVCGRGVGVAIIDSGITSWHDDLNLVDGTLRTADSVVHFKDFTNDANDGRANLPSDGYGHGTHVAGSIAGSGYDSDGARAGIAPCASLIALKVLDAERQWLHQRCHRRARLRGGK